MRWSLRRRPAQAVGDATAKHLLIQGFEAARAVAVDDQLCRGCYLDETDEITEEMNGRGGGQYAIASTPLGAHLRGVVYLDTVGASRSLADTSPSLGAPSDG